MTFESTHGTGRWVRRHGKRRYRIGVKQLLKLFPELAESPTRAGTRQAANEWWLQKQRELDSAENSPALVALQILKDHQKRLRVQAAALRDATLIHEIDSRLARIESALLSGQPIPGIQLREPDGTEEAQSDLLSIQKAGIEVLARRKLRQTLEEECNKLAAVLPVTKPPIHDVANRPRFLGEVVDIWLQDRQAASRRVDVGGSREISSGRYMEMVCHLKVFRQFCGDDALLVDANTSETLLRYRTKVLADSERGSIAQETAKRRVQLVRQFLRWAYEQEFTESLPRNLSSRSLAISVERVEPQTFDIELFHRIFRTATDRLRLYLLLMSNCGFRQSDLARMQVKEVNFRVGRISHARIKTTKKNPPVVNYLLWTETLTALRSMIATEKRELTPEALLFTGVRGGPLLTRHIGEDGKERNVSTIDLSYRRVLKKLCIPATEHRSLGKLRTTSASMIRQKFGIELQTLFLGNRFQDVASKHYTSSHDDFRLDEPLKWLREQYGIAELCGTTREVADESC